MLNFWTFSPGLPHWSTKLNGLFCLHFIGNEKAGGSIPPVAPDYLYLLLIKIYKENKEIIENNVDLFSKTVLYRENEIVTLEDSKNNIIAITSLLKSSEVDKIIKIKKN